MRRCTVVLASALAGLGAVLVGGCGGGSPSTAPVLVYAKHRFALGIEGGYEERGTLFVAAADGSNPRRLTEGLYPDVSPDGRWVAFRRSSESSGFYVVEIDGGEPRLAARNAGVYDWSPDSSSLALSIGRSLAIVDVESGKRRRIIRGYRITGASFSPTGDEIAWVRYEQLPHPKADLTYREDIYRSAIRGGKSQRLTRSGDSTAPVWGPDLIAFSRFEDDPLTAEFFYEPWVMRPGGNRKRRLGRDRVIVPFGWSEDGRRLLGSYADEASSTPVALDPATGEARPIGRFGGEAFTQGFSRDGRYVLVWDEGDLVRIPWEGGRRQVLVRDVDEVADWSL